ncbi:nucleotidyltransferase family protein [Anaerophaga thermohalophila]|uniref:nucleotidyltransferase family protein n=1 Tax=Anaerophaga thermohalophila TaxID=177400 RepID=UPI0002E29E3D|nr:nucleotidyltransferase domain-containing protein [Anaerophaga thermohalophila]
MGKTTNKRVTIPGIDNRNMELIINSLKQFPEIESAIVFGSRAMGNFKNSSDIDIALKGNGINQLTYTKLSGILNDELPLPWYFDVIPFDIIENNSLKDHINRVGIEFYNNENNS